MAKEKGLKNRLNKPFFNPLSWCGKWDLNPYVKDTRPSNVPVCLFQHYRISECKSYYIKTFRQCQGLFLNFLNIYFSFRQGL